MRWSSRFQFLRWPLTSFGEGTGLREADFPLSEKVKRTRYPIHAMRYWWVHCAILDEMKRLGRGPVVCDLGCGPGMVKRFFPVPGARWIALDMNIQNVSLLKAGYDEVRACNFDEPLPLAAESVDIVVCIHVFEHLPRPAFTMGEISRVLRPGGILLSGTPTAPRWVGKIMERKFDHEMARGERAPGRHIHTFSPRQWKDLARWGGLRVEFLCGSHMMRLSGSLLENLAVWARMNQLWGALFPSLGSEVYLQSRLAEKKSR
jgi:SAM-dependent methyltransferase